jgi:hypothetical protein
MKHLPIGGSTAARTLACPAWLARAKKVPKPKSSTYADEGNLLHDAMEEYYKNGREFSEMLGTLTYADHTLNEDHMERLLTPARDAVEGALDRFDIDQFVCEPFVQ